MLTRCLEFSLRFPPKLQYYITTEKQIKFYCLRGRVRPSPFTKMNKVEIFLLEALILQIEFRLPLDLFSTMYRVWEQTVTENCFEIKISLYVADVI